MLTFKGSSPDAAKKNEKKPKLEGSGITFVQKVYKGETFLVMAQAGVELEDEFSSLYFTASNQSNLFLMPPFEPNTLMNLVQTNNILGQCIEAMEVNIDGTGHEFIPIEEGGTIEAAEEKTATSFFNEPCPNESFVDIRRKLRRTLESVGYGYLEVLENVNGDIVGLRNIETNHVRMVKLDLPIRVKKTISRDGKDVELDMWVRERRFAQTVALKQLVYYREYGTTREINRDTGNWEDPAKPETAVPPEMRGSKLIMFGVHPDHRTPYFVPRWINNLPSVIGSRSAEEQNLEFLDAGGMPPAIIFVQGGVLVKDASDQLRQYLSGKNKNKNRAVVVEVQSSSGSMDSTQKVDVKTERFGAQQAQDAMFMKYDESTEEHVRTSFRLPPLFLGKAADYNFATAQTGYMVAEAQVFLPERTKFDEAINKTVIKALGLKTLKLKSKPITLKDVATQLKGLQLAALVASRESFLKDINTAAGTQLELADIAHPNVAPDQAHPGVPTVAEVAPEKLPAATPSAPPTSPQPKPPEPGPTPNQQTMEQLSIEEKKAKIAAMNAAMKQKKAAMELIDMAHDYAISVGLVEKRTLTPQRELILKQEIENLHPEDELAFNRLVSTYVFGSNEDELVDILVRS